MKISFEQEKKKKNRDNIISKSREVKKVRAEVKKLCGKFPIKKRY